jgi:hypothetical protein
MNSLAEQSFLRLKNYCEKEHYKGWDPYDGLSSKVFKSIPFLKNNRLIRLSWIQLFKRNPINFRPIAMVPKEYNSKGIALFLTAYCNLYKINPSEENLKKINFFAEKLIGQQNKNYSGSCWGYYFDWQARAFFQPAHTPTIVATSFVADALMNAYDITSHPEYLNTALSSTDFVLKDLNRTYDQEGNFCFSYSPIDKTQVYNASLLGARLLSRSFFYTQKNILKEEAVKAVKFACLHQQSNGAWAYGTLPFHNWVDNFHTGFNLECVSEYQKYTGDNAFNENLMKGFDYYTKTFFLPNGISKYYENQTHPIDIHAPAQLIVTLYKLNQFSKHYDLADKVLNWTIENMQDREGYFYYQKRKLISSKIPYMRWAQAWMFYSLSYYKLFSQQQNPNVKENTIIGNTSR